MISPKTGAVKMLDSFYPSKKLVTIKKLPIRYGSVDTDQSKDGAGWLGPMSQPKKYRYKKIVKNDNCKTVK